MIKVPFYEFKESILPSKRWKLNEEGKWRPNSEDLSCTNYEIMKEFPLKLDLPAYNEVDYESNFSGKRMFCMEFLIILDENWNKFETDLLWDLCEKFSLKFIIIQDRFNWEMKLRNGKSFVEKTIEEIKERFFKINEKLTGDKFIYDKAIDQKRRLILESYHSRSFEQSLEEAFVLDYLAKLQQNDELKNRLSERIETIKMLAGEQFTAGWPTLPELLKIAAGKGVARLTEKSKKNKKKKKKNPSQLSQNGSIKGTDSSTKQTATKSQASSAPAKKIKIGSTPYNSGNIYLMSSKINPLRVGSARAVEKILSDLNLPFKPDLPTPAVVQKFDQIRSAIIKLIDLRKAAGLPPSKSLETQEK